ncbi:MAG: hypothetical protein R3345_07555 [Fulvivirga sp.]|nr:hypothetical protein [Fulvivirga sp.]
MNRIKFFVSLFTLFFSCLAASAQVVELDENDGLYYFSGTLDNATKVEFNMQLKGYNVSGSYILESSGDMFVFSGRLSLNREEFGVLVYDKNNTYVATIEAYLLSEENSFAKNIKGTWKSADGNTTKSIKLKKVAKFASSPSETSIYKNAVGH